MHRKGSTEGQLMPRPSLKAVAEETLRIQDRGWYRSPDGQQVDLEEAQRQAQEGTRLYRPSDFSTIASASPAISNGVCKIELTGEKVQEAARRLTLDEGEEEVAVLNFASARHVGGGFLKGARAQEEDIARCSGLFRCLETQPGYYLANRLEESLLYTDHLIFSPRVPWFRDQNLGLLATPFLASIISAPAPNAKAYLQQWADGQARIAEVLDRRVRNVLAVARHHRQTSLVLGAWGCGVFGNDPNLVAEAFRKWLQGGFAGDFRRIVFAVYSSERQRSIFSAFERYFGRP